MIALQKLQNLRKILQGMDSILVAFSGGVDSTFLLAVARQVLSREQVLAATATSPTFPRREVAEAKRLARFLDVKHVLIESKETENPMFRANPVNRCYFCKKELFLAFKQMAQDRMIAWIAEGSTQDDLFDHRPGRKAIEELGIRSPLMEAGLTKEEIRQLSRHLDLPTWNKPPFACLASRFPYGDPISEEHLRMVDEAERTLLGLGFQTIRVRVHGAMARIEITTGDLNRLMEAALREHVVRKLKSIGFTYVTLDLEGYRSGSMNEVLKEVEATRSRRGSRSREGIDKAHWVAKIDRGYCRDRHREPLFSPNPFPKNRRRRSEMLGR